MSKTVKDVLSELGVEYDHGVTLSAKDLNWRGVGDISLEQNPDGSLKVELGQRMPSMSMSNVTEKDFVSVVNDALATIPKPIALEIKKYIVDLNGGMFFSTSDRGGTLVTRRDNAGGFVRETANPSDFLTAIQMDGTSDREIGRAHV